MLKPIKMSIWVSAFECFPSKTYLPHSSGLIRWHVFPKYTLARQPRKVTHESQLTERKPPRDQYLTTLLSVMKNFSIKTTTITLTAKDNIQHRHYSDSKIQGCIGRGWRLTGWQKIRTNPCHSVSPHHWVAEFRFPKGTGLFSRNRDLTIILSGVLVVREGVH